MPKIFKNLKILVINLKAIQLGLKIMSITIIHYNYIKNVETFLEMNLLIDVNENMAQKNEKHYVGATQF